MKSQQALEKEIEYVDKCLARGNGANDPNYPMFLKARKRILNDLKYYSK